MSEQLQLLITVVILGMMALAVYRSGKANPKDTAQLDDDMKGISDRLTKVEAAIEDLPTVKDVEGLRGDVKALKASIGHISETIKGTEAAVVRVEQHLLAAATRGRR